MPVQRRGRASEIGAVVLGSDFKALGLVRSLGRRGIPSVVVDDVPRSAWYSRYVVGRVRWKGAMWGVPFRNFLMELAHEHRLDGWVLWPAQDEVVELVARNVAMLGSVYRLVTPDWATLRWGHKKTLLYEIAKELGLSYPRTWYPSGENDLDELPITFPAIVKPAISVRMMYAIGRKALPADNVAELRQQYRSAASILAAQDIMVQETIPGDGHSQYAVGSFCKSGSVIAAMTVRRRRQYPLDYGLSSSFVESIEVPDLLRVATRLLGRLGLSGMVEVEFKQDQRDGLFKLLDVNVRPWGWHSLCIACGLDFPYMQYADALGLPLPAVLPRYGPRWRRLITDVPAALAEIRRGILPPWSYLASLLAGNSVGSVLDYRDPLPAIADLAIAIARLGLGPNRGWSQIPAADASESEESLPAAGAAIHAHQPASG